MELKPYFIVISEEGDGEEDGEVISTALILAPDTDIAKEELSKVLVDKGFSGVRVDLVITPFDEAFLSRVVSSGVLFYDPVRERALENSRKIGEGNIDGILH